MLLLFETPAGFALFKVLKEGKFKQVENIYSQFEDEENAKKLVQLQAFNKFKNTKDAIVCTNKLLKGKIPKKLSKFLQENIISKEIQENLAIADKKLAKSITEKMGIQCQTDEKVNQLFRGIRLQMNNLISGLNEDEFTSMTVGLAHGLSRYKLKFSIEKVDTMIIQAISLLDDLDKEINNYMMRLREWYGWHFPELSKIIQDNLIYAKTVNKIGQRHKTHDLDFEGLLTEEIEKEVKDAAEISMGTEINETDEKYILSLSQQVIELSEYRESLNEYLKNRMSVIAPNLSMMVGELVGARLIAHAGSLVNLAKYPASTVQILGAEKALFKAIRTKHNTPKYGLIFQTSLVSAAQNKMKGKISRALASKCALCIRVDALGESENSEIGTESKQYIEKRIAFLEGGQFAEGGSKPQKKQLQKLDQKEKFQAGTSAYNTGSDILGLPQLSQTFKKSKNLAEETQQVVGEKRKGIKNTEETDQVEQQVSKKKKVKKVQESSDVEENEQ